MILLRIYLLLGLVAHKLVWEVLKRAPAPARTNGPVSLGRRLVKMGKIAFLAGITVQTLLPDLLPIAKDPQLLRVLGVAIYTLGLGIAVCGRMQLGANWIDIEDARVLAGQQIVATGLYRYVRHPIYLGDLLLLIGFELSLNSWLFLGVVLLSVIVTSRARHEEALLRAQLPGYAQYADATARFVPFLY